jgi:BAI1-associated protein 3
MSFFNSLQQYVTSSVANLSLSPKRFSLSRDSSGESSTDGTGSHPPLTPGPTGSSGGTVTGGRSASAGNVIVSPAAASHGGPSVLHGFPKVVPPPGTVTPPHSRSLSVRRRTLECPPPPGLVLPPGTGPPRRLGSFRKTSQQQQQQATTPGSAGISRQPLMFCRRRQSWPEVDQQATSG